MSHENEPYTQDPYAGAHQIAMDPAPRRKSAAGRWLAVAGVALLLVGLVVAGTWVRAEATSDRAVMLPARTRLETAEARCAEWSPYVHVGDEGRSLTVRNAAARQVDGAEAEELDCILAELDTPDAVLERIGATRALDGMQDAQWDGLTASWTFHPDDGLTLIVSESR